LQLLQKDTDYFSCVKYTTINRYISKRICFPDTNCSKQIKAFLNKESITLGGVYIEHTEHTFWIDKLYPIGLYALGLHWCSNKNI